MILSSLLLVCRYSSSATGFGSASVSLETLEPSHDDALVNHGLAGLLVASPYASRSRARGMATRARVDVRGVARRIVRIASHRIVSRRTARSVASSLAAPSFQIVSVYVSLRFASRAARRRALRFVRVAVARASSSSRASTASRVSIAARWLGVIRVVLTLFFLASFPSFAAVTRRRRASSSRAKIKKKSWINHFSYF